MGRLRKPGREKAAQLLAEGRLSDQKVADLVGVSRQTLFDWKTKDPAFGAHLQELLKKSSEEALKYGIARRETRIAVQQELQSKLLTVIDERAKDAQDNGSTVPGMKTGLVCKTIKGIGKGEDFQVVEVYETDTPTVKALLALHEQAAKETGQFVEAEVKVKHDLATVIAEARKRVAEAKTASGTRLFTSKGGTSERVN